MALSHLAGMTQSVKRDDAAAEESWLMPVDVETVRDRSILSPDFPADQFPKPIFHQVVAISFLLAKIIKEGSHVRFEVSECRSGGTEQSSEADLIGGFWQLAKTRQPTFVTWGGRTFDFPVLKQRSMVHGISAAWLHKAGDKWNNYNHRYSADYHCDLMDSMSDYHAAPYLSLEEIAEAIGIPGKVNGHGREVEAMVAEGRLSDVRGYCDSDVLSLFGAYIRWCLLTGRSTPEGHDASMRSLLNYLEQEAPKRPHLAKFLDVWKKSVRPKPMFVLPQEPAVPTAA